MNDSAADTTPRSNARAVLAETLETSIEGEVRFDALTRTLYATDASIYEITPIGVVLPRTVDDVLHAVNHCRAAGVSIVARERHRAGRAARRPRDQRGQRRADLIDSREVTAGRRAGARPTPCREP